MDNHIFFNFRKPHLDFFLSSPLPSIFYIHGYERNSRAFRFSREISRERGLDPRTALGKPGCLGPYMWMNIKQMNKWDTVYDKSIRLH